MNWNEKNLGIITKDYLDDITDGTDKSYIVLKGLYRSTNESKYPLTFEDVLNYMNVKGYDFAGMLETERDEKGTILFKRIDTSKSIKKTYKRKGE